MSDTAGCVLAPDPDGAVGCEKTVHIIDADHASRADFARSVFAIGLHAEVYASFAELTGYRPTRGLLIYRWLGTDELCEIMAQLRDAGMILPLIVASNGTGVDWAVSAMKAGAIDCLALPAPIEGLRTVIERAAHEAARYSAARQHLIEARRRIGALTPREREVLDRLTEGCSNKEIGRLLEISSRTVEIHRGNMMVKLGAKHPAHAIRLRLQAAD